MFEFGDSETYWKLGESIYHGQPYAYGPREYRVMRTPGYPFLLAMLMRVTGGAATPWDARLLSVALGVVAVLATYGLGRLVFDARVALLAAAIAAIAPCAVASSVFVLAEAPFIPVMLAQLACWWMWLSANSAKRAMLFACATGALAGIGVLVRPSWLLFAPLSLILMLWAYRHSSEVRRLRVAPVIACLVVFAATVSVWWVRNFQISGHFISTTLQAGPSLYDGWRPDADGATDMRFVEEFEALADKEISIPRTGIQREIILDQRMSSAAWKWACENPLRVVQLAFIKLLRTWNVIPNFSEMQSPALRIGVLLGYAPVMLCAALGAWKFRTRGDVLLVCSLPAVYFSLLHMIFAGSIRYRQPAMFPLFVLSAAWIVSFLSSFWAPAAKEASA